MGNPSEDRAGDDTRASGDDQTEGTLRADWGTNDVLHGSGAPRSTADRQGGRLGGGR